MQLSANLIAEVAIYGLVGISFAYFFSLFWLYGQMIALAKIRPDLQALLPDRN